MKDSAINKFQELCLKAKKAWDENTFGTKELEPFLLEILITVKKNISYRKDFSKEFIKLLKDYKYGPLEIVVFCMRELQWEEIKKAALDRQLETEDPRIKSSMQDVLKVYEPEWEDSDLYEYYSKQKN